MVAPRITRERCRGLMPSARITLEHAGPEHGHEREDHHQERERCQASTTLHGHVVLPAEVAARDADGRGEGVAEEHGAEATVTDTRAP